MSSAQHVETYPRFLWRSAKVATDGTLPFYAWMTFLTAVGLVGLNAWAEQVASGMAVTGMSDHVSWGLYIANFTYLVGLAAGAVTMVIPAYLYKDRATHDVVIVGEILAVAAIVMALAFVNVDIGRPDRFWHILPFVGRFHWPVSMLTWDVIALGGYLLINLHVVGYLVYTRYRGERPAKRWYLPVVMLSIVWAVSIHTVTAFLYSGLGGRPFWNTAILAPRFIVSAFVTGPAFIILTLMVLRKVADLRVGEAAIGTLMKILKVTVLINLFLLGCELFTIFYGGGTHAAAGQYLWFGLHGYSGLVPWAWGALALNTAAAIMLLTVDHEEQLGVLIAACAMTLFGIWIEKGMGLIVAGFVPSTLHEIVEYSPSMTEWQVTAGIWAFGLGTYTIGLKVAHAVFTGRMRDQAGA